MTTKFEWHDYVLIGLGVVVLIVSTIIILMNYGTMPDQIPMHYDFDGTVTNLSSKKEIIFLVVMDWFIYGVMIVSIFFPKMWNMPQVSPQNAPRAVFVTKKMLEVMALLLTIMFSYLMLSSGGILPYFNWLLFVFLGIIFFGTFGCVIYLMILK